MNFKVRFHPFHRSNDRLRHRELRPERAVYRIQEAIGQGLSATVYRAIREDSRGLARQTVALKVLKSENAVPWLRREFETLARLNSPNCVRVLAWENLPEGCALVLEWIEGVTLLELARGKCVSGAAASSLIAQIQEGLRALFAQGLHHGDLSPGNVLVDREGVVKLIDFAMPEEPSSELMGTLEYLSPERWAGDSAGAAADLFALGLLAHDLDTGFIDHPMTALQARARATRLAQKEAGWLADNPASRTLRSVAADETGRRELANLVGEKLRERVRVETRTTADGPSSVMSQRLSRRALLAMRFAVSLAALIASLAAPGRADAPSAAQEARGSLEIRSQNWLEVTINGRRIGYAPVAIPALQPGSHRISWRSAFGKGETRIVLRVGERVRLFADAAQSKGRIRFPVFRASAIKD